MHHAEGRVGALELLAQDAQADVVDARPAVLAPGSARPGSPSSRHALEDLAMDLVLGVPLADVRLDLAPREVADGRLDELVLVAQRKVDHVVSEL